MTTVFIPCDSASLAAGANEVVDALHKEATARGIAIDVQRNSSRGMFWLEPLVEVVTAKGRMAYGPVTFEDVPSLFEAGFLNGGLRLLFCESQALDVLNIIDTAIARNNQAQRATVR